MSETAQPHPMWRWMSPILFVVAALSAITATYMTWGNPNPPPHWLKLVYSVFEAAVGLLALRPDSTIRRPWSIGFAAAFLLMSAVNLYQFFSTKG